MTEVLLPHWHYASTWGTDESVIKPLEEVTEMGCRYAETKDSTILLELCKCFHPYLMKYLVMIVRGHMPVRGTGGPKINYDVEPFIRYFLPKGETLNKVTILKSFAIST
jgi:hypothetical protein